MVIGSGLIGILNVPWAVDHFRIGQLVAGALSTMTATGMGWTAWRRYRGPLAKLSGSNIHVVDINGRSITVDRDAVARLRFTRQAISFIDAEGREIGSTPHHGWTLRDRTRLTAAWGFTDDDDVPLSASRAG
jgi:hypothetical protein